MPKVSGSKGLWDPIPRAAARMQPKPRRDSSTTRAGSGRVAALSTVP